MSPSTPRAKAVMVYDGDCDFCRRWVRRWQSLTGDAIEYVPYQVGGHRFPHIRAERFAAAVHLIQPDSATTSGARAVFEALRCVPGRRWMLSVYEHAPGAAAIAEWGYSWVARNRGWLARPTAWLWGDSLDRPSYRLTRCLFIRLLGVVYFFAFLSLWMQWPGLIGSGGILPAASFLDAVEQHLGVERYWRLPTVFWLRCDDSALGVACGAGAALSALLIVGIAPGPALLLLWGLYLSVSVVGQDFLSFQWDTLLLETGLLAAFFAPWRLLDRPGRGPQPSRLVLWLLRWLLFRLMFLSGVTKLSYADPTWHDLTALLYHYQTQPLPTWLGWYAHQLPAWFQKLSVLLMFVVEIGIPFLIVGPRRLRYFAFMALMLLQILIAVTGNYGFFNLLAMALCVLLLDDAILARLLPRSRRVHWPMNDVPAAGSRWRRTIRTLLASGVLIVSALEGWQEVFGRDALSPVVVGTLEPLRPFRSINGYGLFRVMTITRPEIVIEGSNDGRIWLEYEFRYKPGDLRRAPRFNAPHQPRLDWQMWFAALGAPRHPPWFVNFVRRLLDGSPRVMSLLERNPFPDAPPRYLRATLYRYEFTDRAARAKSGDWWRRERLGEYVRPIGLPPARGPRS